VLGADKEERFPISFTKKRKKRVGREREEEKSWKRSSISSTLNKGNSESRAGRLRQRRKGGNGRENEPEEIQRACWKKKWKTKREEQQAEASENPVQGLTLTFNTSKRKNRGNEEQRSRWSERTSFTTLWSPTNQRKGTRKKGPPAKEGYLGERVTVLEKRNQLKAQKKQPWGLQSPYTIGRLEASEDGDSALKRQPERGRRRTTHQDQMRTWGSKTQQGKNNHDIQEKDPSMGKGKSIPC